MLLDEPIEVEGEFWLPGESDRKTPGSLTIDVNGAANLKLTDFVSGNKQAHYSAVNLPAGSLIPPMRIVGVARSMGSVTLDNCYAKSLPRGFGMRNPTNYAVGRVLAGAKYEPNQEIELNEIQFNVEGLDDWVGVSGFTLGNSDDFSKVWVNYTAPDDINLMESEELSIGIVFSWQPPTWNITQTEAAIRQTALLQIKTSEPKPIDDLLGIALRVRDFVSLGIGRNALITRVTGFTDSLSQKLDDGAVYHQPLKLYFHDSRRRESENIPVRDRMLMDFAKTQNSGTSHLRKWLDSYADHDGPISSFFGVFEIRSVELADKFLDLFQVAETLHKQTSSETKMSRADLRARVRLIKAAFTDDEEFAEVLSEAFRRTNELSARERLTRVFKDHLDFEVDEETLNEVCGAIARTRAKLTHEAGANNVEVVMGHNVWGKAHALDAIIRIWLLKLSGFDDDAIQASLDRKPALREALTMMFQTGNVEG